jgi:hypothetical protein
MVAPSDLAHGADKRVGASGNEAGASGTRVDATIKNVDATGKDGQ